MELKPDGKNRYIIPRSGNMQASVRVYVNEKLRKMLSDDRSIQQLVDAATLPGVVDPVVGMPDIHEGFGLPIGGVMAMHEDGVISAGAVGMDINCGVRLLKTDLDAVDLQEKHLRRLMTTVDQNVPTGVGQKSQRHKFGAPAFDKILQNGVRALVELGLAEESELDYIEEQGCLSGARLPAVSREAYYRGIEQLGTLGGGNHFIEFQEVTDIYDPELARRFGLYPGQFTVMIHTGSRGFGHQICTEYSRGLLAAAPKYKLVLPNKGLASAPIDSPEGRSYYQAMACAVNFAFSNRQIIHYEVARSLDKIFGSTWRQKGHSLVYDVAHNIAKWEEHRNKRLLVHRKGATRALAAGNKGNPGPYRATGHPALIPGSMGTASYVLVGRPAAAETYFSVNHGAGRVLSRKAASRSISLEEFENSMEGILYGPRNFKDIVDEAPLAYKDIDEVVDSLAEIGLTHKVARLWPLAVLKGKD